MSRNFRQSQLLDAFDFDSSNVLEQLRENFIQVHSGSGTPASSLGLDGNVYFDTRGDIIYVKIGGTWEVASSRSGSTATLQQELNALPAESSYTYDMVLTTDYDQANGDAFFDGTDLTLYFRTGFTVPTTLYGWTTAPVGATGDEPDLVIHHIRTTGITSGGFTASTFNVTRGTIPLFGPPPGTPTILQTLYTRGMGSITEEFLRKNADGSYDFAEVPEAAL